MKEHLELSLIEEEWEGGMGQREKGWDKGRRDGTKERGMGQRKEGWDK